MARKKPTSKKKQTSVEQSADDTIPIPVQNSRTARSKRMQQSKKQTTKTVVKIDPEILTEDEPQHEETKQMEPNANSVSTIEALERRENQTEPEEEKREEFKAIELIPEPVPVSDEVLKKWKALAKSTKAKLKISLKQGIPKIVDEVEPEGDSDKIEKILKEQCDAYN